MAPSTMPESLKIGSAGDSNASLAANSSLSAPYTCNFCQRTFPRLSLLKKHEQVGSVESPLIATSHHSQFLPISLHPVGLDVNSSMLQSISFPSFRSTRGGTGGVIHSFGSCIYFSRFLNGNRCWVLLSLKSICPLILLFK